MRYPPWEGWRYTGNGWEVPGPHVSLLTVHRLRRAIGRDNWSTSASRYPDTGTMRSPLMHVRMSEIVRIACFISASDGDPTQEAFFRVISMKPREIAALRAMIALL